MTNWGVADTYEAYVGRWSRRVAPEFAAWLDAPTGARWLDVGCGTGALAGTALATEEPSGVAAVDTSVGFLRTAAAANPGVAFACADARALPFADGEFGAVVSGLVLNFVPQPGRAAAELARVTASGGVAGAYVWDYAAGMELMRLFWDAATELDPAAAELDEGRRPGICAPEPLAALWRDAGFRDVEVRPIVVPTDFTGFDDYWTPFLGAQGPAPTYVARLPQDHRDALQALLRTRVPTDPSGRIHLHAKTWSVRGTR